MSYPFGHQPKLSEYLKWATEQGCEIKYGVIAKDGGACNMTLIISPDGKRFVNIGGEQQGNWLSPTYLHYIERRLGIKSDWPSWPAPNRDR